MRLKTYDDGEVGVDLSELLENTNVTVEDVHWYEVEMIDRQIQITLYDIDKKKIKVEKC